MKLGSLLLLVTPLVAVTLLACGDDDDRADPMVLGDAGSNVDGTSPPTVDAGGREAASPLFADPSQLGVEPDRDDGARCVESAADAQGAPLGCEESTCRQQSRACCVGQADCCSDMPESLSFRFDTCTEDCVDGVLFGSPLPTLVHGFSPGGDAEFDSGVVLDQRVDLRGEKVRLSAEFVAPTASCSGASCFQTVGVSVAYNAPNNASAHVRTIAGLLLSDGRMYLVVGERSIQSWAAADGLWSLTIDADGDVRVQSMSGEAAIDETFPTTILPSEAYIVLHGHNVNPGGGEESAQLLSLEVTSSQCEMTRQWGARTAVEVGSGLRDTLTGATSPTSARDAEGRLRIAYLHEGRLITTLRGNEETPSVWVDADDAYDALLRPEGTVVRSPELADEDGSLVLFYEVDGRLFRAERTDDDARLSFSDGEPVEGATVEGATIHAPTYTSRGDAPEAALIARVEWDDGRRPTLAAFAVSNVSGTVVAEHRDLLPTAALGEELGDPELFIRNRLYQLYVPYRRGTRWRLAHLTSEDFVYWNIADDAALESGGPDELFGPRAPETVVSEAGVELFYERFDGTEQSFGRVFRRTPSQAMFQEGI